MEPRDRFLGCLIGLAVGDALGTTLEFRPRGTFTPLDDMVGGGPFGLEPGRWTDDTSMALCLADSLIACVGFDPADQMRRYVRWWREGYRSSRPGICFDIGNTVRRALGRFERTGQSLAGSVDPQAAGNGSLMRLAPVPMFYATNPAVALEKAAESSRTTHGAPDAVDACRYFAGLLVGALRGETKAMLLSPSFSPLGGIGDEVPLAARIRAIAEGSYKGRPSSAIQASGYVAHTLEAALWAFSASSSFREGALLAVNLGDDADTTGAVYGQLAGAFYGMDAIPSEWCERLYAREAITAVAMQLFEHGREREPPAED